MTGLDSFTNATAPSPLVDQIREKPPATEQPSILNDFARAAAYSAIQSPAVAMAQAVDKATGSNLAHSVHIIDRPKQAEFGSVAWHLQQAGASVGGLVPFVAALAVTKGGVASVEATRVASNASRIAVTSNASVMRTGEMAGAGFLQGAILEPNDNKDNFIKERLTHGITSGVAMGSMHVMAGKLSELTGANSMGASYLNKALTSGLAGAGGSAVGLGADSILTGKEITGTSAWQSVYQGAWTGVLLGGFGADPLRLLESKSKLQETKPYSPGPTRSATDLAMNAPSTSANEISAISSSSIGSLNRSIGTSTLKPGPVLSWPPDASYGERLWRPENAGTFYENRVANGFELGHLSGLKITRMDNGTVVTECPLSGLKTTIRDAENATIVTRNGSTIERKIQADGTADYSVTRTAHSDDIEIAKVDGKRTVTIKDDEGNRINLGEKIEVTLPTGLRTVINRDYKQWTLWDVDGFGYTSRVDRENYLRIRTNEPFMEESTSRDWSPDETKLYRREASRINGEKERPEDKQVLELYRKRLLKAGVEPKELLLSNPDHVADFIKTVVPSIDKFHAQKDLEGLKASILHYAQAKGLPVTRVVEIPGDGMAAFDVSNGILKINDQTLANASPAGQIVLAKSIYHELGHADQGRVLILHMADKIARENGGIAPDATKVSDRIYSEMNADILLSPHWDANMIAGVLSQRTGYLPEPQAVRAKAIMSSLGRQPMWMAPYFNLYIERESFYLGNLLQAKLLGA